MSTPDPISVIAEALNDAGQDPETAGAILAALTKRFHTYRIGGPATSAPEETWLTLRLPDAQ